MSTNWNNVLGGDWQTLGDWSLGVPVSTTGAIIGLNTYTFTVTLASGELNDQALSLSIDNAHATVNMDSTLTLGTSSTSGFLTNSGTLNVGAGTAGDGASVTMGGQFTNFGDANFGSTGNTAVGASSVGVLINRGTLTLAGKSGFGETLTASGNVTNNGSLSVGANSSLILSDTGKTFTQGGAAAKTTVAGTLTANHLTINSGSFTDTGTFDNTGTLTVNGGVANFTGTFDGLLTGTATGAGTLTGAANIKVGTTGTLAGTLVLPGTVSALGSGTTLTMAGAGATASLIENNLTSVASGATLNVDGGHVFNGGTNALTVAGSLNIDHLSTLTEAALTISSTGTVTNAGTITHAVADNGLLILQTHDLINGALTGSGTVYLETGIGAGTFVSAATLGAVDVKTGTWTVDATPTTLAGAMTGNAPSTLNFTSTGTITLNGVTKFGTIDLANGTNQITLTSSNLGTGVTLNGGGGTDTILASGTAGQRLTFVAGASSTGDAFTGGAENDIVKGAASALTGDTLTGGAGNNAIMLTGTAGGAVDLTHASQFQTINLGAGTVGASVTLGTLGFVAAGGTKVNNVRVNGSTTVAHDTVKSIATGTFAAKGTLDYVMGANTTLNTFTGDAEIDYVTGTAAEVTGDTLKGGTDFSRNNLVLRSDGIVNLSSVSNFGDITLSAAGTSVNTVTISSTTLTGTNGTTKTGPRLTIRDANNLAGTTLTSTGTVNQALTFVAGNKVDTFQGGAEDDLVLVSATAVKQTGESLTGGTGTSVLKVTTAGTFNLTGHVANFGEIDLAGGTNVVTNVSHTMFDTASGMLLINGDGSANTITSGDGTSTDVLTYKTASKTTFTGSSEQDIVNISATGVSGSTLTGSGNASNKLNITNVGVVNLAGVKKFPTINMAAGNNTVDVSSVTLSGGTVTINAAAAGGAGSTNTINVTGTAGQSLIYDASGVSKAKTTFNAGLETDTFTFENVAAGVETIGGFKTASDLLDINSSTGGFNNSGVSFTGIDATHDYYYNSTTGDLNYSASGTGSGTTIAVLTGTTHPVLGTGNFGFV